MDCGDGVRRAETREHGGKIRFIDPAITYILYTYVFLLLYGCILTIRSLDDSVVDKK